MGLLRMIARGVVLKVWYRELFHRMQQAQNLVITGKPAEAVRLLEQETGLGAEDYGSPATLRSKLSARCASLPPELATSYVLTLASTLSGDRRTLDGQRVLDAFLGFDRSDYRDVAHLARKLRVRTEGLPDDMQAAVLYSVVGSLGVRGRDLEGAALLGADLGLDPEEMRLDPVAEFETKLARRLAGLLPDITAMYLEMVVMSLDELGVGPQGVTAFERYLGLLPADYASAENLTAKLTPWLNGMSEPVSGVVAVNTLASCLEQAGRPESGISLLEWYFGVEQTDYRDVEVLERKWRAIRDSSLADLGLTIWRVWGDMLVGAGRAGDALALLQADSSLRLDDLYTPERFGPKLRQRLHGAQIDTQAAYIVSLMAELDMLAYVDAAASIVDWYLRTHRNLWEVPADGDPAVVHVIPLLDRWLDALLPGYPQLAWQVSERAVLYLRGSFLLTDLAISDRREFIRYIGDLRQKIRQVGDLWSTVSEPAAEHEPLTIQAQLWDAELGQRLRFEEFLLMTVASIEPSAVPEDRWPLEVAEPVEVAGHLPDPDACPDAHMVQLLSDTGADRLADAGQAADETDERPPPPEQWLTSAEEIVRAGVTEALLAETIGPSAVLVRAGFRADGALVWAALRATNDTRLGLVASGVGSTTDHWRLRWARLRHDLGLLTACTPVNQTVEDAPYGRAMSAREMLVKILTEACEAIVVELDRVIASGGISDDLLREIAPILALLNSPKSSIAKGERLGYRLGELMPPAGAPASAFAPVLRDEITTLAAAVARHPDGAREHRPLAEIDDVTRRYLHDVASVWRLDALVDRLSAEDDLVFQLEDSLQAVPIAHYPRSDGTPLYAHVRSTRVSFSMLFTIMQERVEREFATDAGRLLALSHFPPGDAAGEYAKWLHHGQRWLARERPANELTCLNAAETPLGAPGALCAAVDMYQAFQAVTVCGHGSAHEAGIELAGRRWDGTGCDWRAVNLLLMVSCSVGRLEQTEDQDIEGLCVRLALHRARSVVACRWPVIAPQAIAFSNEVVAQYLELRRQASEGTTTGTNLRARAVNAARHRFLGGGDTRSDGEIVQLNTVAAFELYGLG
ncbi:MAG: hypothetical protein ACRDRS_09245 [Pseudonocardiaceae bacterium]